jgi:hypothetical protein
VKTRRGSRDAVPADGGDLEDWLRDLVGGETSARRLRERLDAAGEGIAGACAVCDAATSGEVHSGHDGHLPGRLSA